MTICDAPLSFSFASPLSSLVPLYGLGLAGILGWGMLFERVAGRWLAYRSRLHAFVEGTVVTSVLLLIASCLGYPGGAKPVAILGAALVVPLWVADRREVRGKAQEVDAWRWIRVIEGIALALLLVPLVVSLTFEPIKYNDLAYIWSFRGKELACEPLFDSRFFREKFWAGTHPEYPLFLPLLFAYFFSLANSFRDDFVKIWEAASVVAAVFLVFRSARLGVRSGGGGRVLPWALTVSCVAILFWGGGDGRVELISTIFTMLVVVAIREKDPGRLPLYLFGLGFSKNESLVAAHVLVALMVAISLWRQERGEGRTARQLPLGFILPWLALDVGWLMIALRLPSNHEQYPQRLLSASAWREGLARMPALGANALKVMMAWPWGLFVLLVPAAVLVVRQQQVNRETSSTRLLFALWSLAMLLVYSVIYVVTPWGASLPLMTERRLLMPFYPVLLVLLVELIGDHWKGAAPAKRRTCGVLTTALLASHAVPLGIFGGGYLRALPDRIEREGLGGFYLLADPAVRAVLHLDSELPPRARGAVLHHPWYFDVNYLFYPRVFYSADPDVPSLTWRPGWHWTTPGDLLQTHPDFDFVVDLDGPASSRIVNLSNSLWEPMDNPTS